ALAWKCGGFGASGLIDLMSDNGLCPNAFSSPSRDANTARPKPEPAFSRKARRVTGWSFSLLAHRLACSSFSSVHISKLARIEKRQAKFDQRLSSACAKERQTALRLLFRGGTPKRQLIGAFNLVD